VIHDEGLDRGCNTEVCSLQHNNHHKSFLRYNYENPLDLAKQLLG
jgi:hypothetical protein